MKKLKNKALIHGVLTTVLMGLLVYAAYSLWYIFYGTESGADIHLYTALSSLALGWFMLVFVSTVIKNSGWVSKLLAFSAGCGFFQGLIWGANAKINPENLDNDKVIIFTFTITFTLSAVLLLASFILKAKIGAKVLHIILALVYFIVSCGGIIVLNEENIKALKYKKNIQFDTISAAELSLTAQEREFCENWYANTFSSENKAFPFTFKVDGKEFNPNEWDCTLKEGGKQGRVYRGGKTSCFVLMNKENGLEVTAEATLFPEKATCQWIVYIKNNGTEKSGVISDFYALDSAFATGKAELYYSMGSNTAASDFSLIKEKLSSKVKSFSGTDGKPTEAFLPYFNVCGEGFGMVVGVGWTGQWVASFAGDDSGAAITVKQEQLNAYLLPDEEIRSPLVSVSFYDSNNALKGFNLFRGWIMESVYPENITQNQYTVMEVAGPTSERTSDEIINILDNEIDPDVYNQIDAFWMDAGWYTYNEGWHDGVGNWIVDSSRYDNGIKELSSYAKEKGIGHTLWYEPERLCRGTHFYNEGVKHEGWLVDVGEDNIMWNLANEEAFDFYCEYLLNSMKENGVTIYRQDFNYPPLKYWQKADAELYDGRTGICENHYVTNLYRYLDYLYENIDGLIIDNCASGGKRLDLEMAYRSIPFWRSDYNCSYHTDLFDATQSHTYGISFWLPISGSALYMAGEYAARSDIMPLMLMDFYSHQHPEFSYHKEQRELMTGNYLPIDFGSFDKDKMHAMQFSTHDGSAGTALIYKRANVKATEYTVKLNGLNPDKEYKVYDIDFPDTVYTLTGKELMGTGITLQLPEGEKAIILMYSAN